MKKCSRCDELKQLEDFSIRKDLADGRFSYCRDCVREYNQQYYRINSDDIKHKTNLRYASDEALKLKRRKYMKAYRARNRGVRS